MKKITMISIAVLVLVLFGVSSVFAGGRQQPQAAAKLEIALITDYGTIDDGSFNQGSWEGVVEYGERHNKRFEYFQPSEVSDAAYLDTIELAIGAGASVIVTPGFLFGASIFAAQDMFPQARFILLDAAPNKDGTTRIGPNTVSVMYAEEQAGFLAGYAAVMDGYRRLGFVGGIPVPAVVRFGRGYVQGANHAAQTLGLAAGAVTIRYHYCGTFAPSPAIQTMAASWYQDGIELIFAAAGGVGFSVFAAAEATGGWAIGVDVDQAHHSPRVITSALKGLQASVYQTIGMHYAGNFPGGQRVMFDASNNGVGLPMATSRFRQVTQAQYDAIFRQLATGAVRVSNDISGGPSGVTSVNAPLIRLTFIN